MVRPESDSARLKSHIRIAKFWTTLNDKQNWVKCNLCHRRCLIAPNAWGVCGVRKNIDGKLYTMVYGLLTAENADPIEKKPLMHFNPGSTVLSISTVGCDFFCAFCQNWEISQSRLEKGLYGERKEPEEIIRDAINIKADGISYTYNEPTIMYEFMYDTASLAKKNDLFNTMVTNGYMTPEAVDDIGNLMDAATVDFKGGGNKEFYRKYMGVPNPEPILETLKAMKDKKIWIEITNLVVPKVGDKDEDIKKLAKWIVENLGDNVPFHLLRFHPDYKMLDSEDTPVKTLERLANIAKNEGLKYVYIGNVPGHQMEHTYCPKCGYPLIERYGFYITAWRLTDDNRCPRCGTKIDIVGKKRSSSPFSLSLL
ncbi:pyruvate-formate lyase-activating enzyme [Caldisphaera lagunensis DSM 15908]|uniref:Pyruvate-formate lyase-activating enzyme n=1 Tax=Caldisphaera lagunensis (strain DSM 15908 / JCM 11604 / ANMR 0165 / IC-154) TaxID=1056495 RepID=L0A8N1_CALLD|nr:AmmeMemoRadiSam system radical SAM enzyme [Caldisphaera lagunensis]AFZ70228.1 pyruvate-formate lyase-activating enzyme [Caldisphaera lagunensis DSM 15908]